MPLVHRRRGVDCNVFRLGLPPAPLGVREKFVDNSRVVTIYPVAVLVMRMGLCPALSTYCILSV